MQRYDHLKAFECIAFVNVAEHKRKLKARSRKGYHVGVSEERPPALVWLKDTGSIVESASVTYTEAEVQPRVPLTDLTRPLLDDSDSDDDQATSHNTRTRSSIGTSPQQALFTAVGLFNTEGDHCFNKLASEFAYKVSVDGFGDGRLRIGQQLSNERSTTS